MAESDFSHTLRSHLRGGRPSPDEHPSPEELAAYRGETLDPEDGAAIRAHLLDCEECRELLLELAALEGSPGEPSGEPSEIELEAAWRKQRERLFARRRPALLPLGGWLAAACLALVVAGLTLEIRDLRQAAAQRGTLDPPWVFAKGLGERDFGTAELPLLALTPDRPGFILLLLDVDTTDSSFRAEFFSGNAAPILVRDGLSAAENLLLIQVTQNLLPAGDVRVVVSVRRQDRYEKIEEYGLRVHHL